MASDPDKNPRTPDNGVPETWRGYLAEPPAGDSARDNRRPGDEGLAPDEREFLERELRRSPDDPESAVAAEAEDFQPQVSRSEGVSFAGQLPFMIFLFAGLLIVMLVAWKFIAPASFDPDSLGPPDKSPELVVRDLFGEIRAGTPLNTVVGSTRIESPIFLVEETAYRYRKLTTLPIFKVPIHQRIIEAADLISDGEFEAKSGTFAPVPGTKGVQSLTYQRRDLTTGAVSNPTIFVARDEPGWRVVGFTP